MRATSSTKSSARATSERKLGTETLIAFLFFEAIENPRFLKIFSTRAGGTEEPRTLVIFSKVRRTVFFRIGFLPTAFTRVALAEDLVEEVARIYGYDQIPETLPSLDIIPDTLPPKRKFQIIHQISDQLVGAGFWETQNFSLVREEVYEKLMPDTYQLLRIFNPQNKELNLMRPDLISGLVETAQRNQARGSKYFKFFEVGQIYHAKGKELPEEKVSIGLIAYGKPSKEWSNDPRAISLYDAKGTVENLVEQLGLDKYEWQEGSSSWMEEGCSLILKARGKTIGALGELKSEALNTFNLEGPVIVGELDLETIIPWVSSERSFQVFSKYPSTTRDLSLMVPQELPVESVRSTILAEGNNWLRDVRLFDIYEGKNIPKGIKSLAFSLEYQSLERTLGSEEVQTEHARIAKVLQDKYNAQLPPATKS